MKKDVRTRIDIRCTKKEKELIAELAYCAGLTVSEYCRQKILGRKVTLRYLDVKNEREINEV